MALLEPAAALHRREAVRACLDVIEPVQNLGHCLLNQALEQIDRRLDMNTEVWHPMKADMVLAAHLTMRPAEQMAKTVARMAVQALNMAQSRDCLMKGMTRPKFGMDSAVQRS
jgi:hypothetical protein